MSKAAPISYAAKAKQTATAQQSAATSRAQSPAASQPATPSQTQQNGTTTSAASSGKHSANGSISGMPSKPVTASYSSVAVSKPSNEAPGQPAPVKEAAAVLNSTPASAIKSPSPLSAPADSKPATSQVNGTASKESAPAPRALPKIDFNSFFQGGGASSSNPPSPPAATAPAESAPSNDSAFARRSLSTYDPTVSPRPPQASVSPAPSTAFQSLAGSARPFSPAGPSGTLSPAPYQPPPHQQPYGQQFYPSASYGASGKSPNSNSGGFVNNYNNAGPNSRQQQSGFANRGGMSGPQRSYQMGPASPRLPNGQLPGQQQPQSFAYPPPAGQAGSWQQHQQQQQHGYGAPYPGYQQYYSPNFVPQQQSGANLSASSGPPSLARSSSSGLIPTAGSQHSNSPQMTPASLMSSTTSSVSGWQPPSAASTNPSTPAPSTPSMSNNTLPGSTPSSAFRPGAASFNPAAHSFSPSPGIFTPAKKSAAILIRKPPSTPSKEKPSAPSTPSLPPVADKAQDEADAKKAKDAQEANEKAKTEAAVASKAKAEQEAAEKEAQDKAASEAKAKEEAAAKAKKEADEKAESERVARQKADAEQEEKKQREAAEKEQADKDAKAKAAEEQAQLAAAEVASKKAEEEQKASEAAVAEAKEKEQKQNEEAAKSVAQDRPATDSESKPDTRSTSPAPVESSQSAEDTSEKKRTAPQPLDLEKKSGHARQPLTDPRPVSNAALRSAKSIADLKSIDYPESISSPVANLNANAEPGKFRYDRDFLMQFMSICRERPEQLPSLEAIGMSDSDGSVYTPANGSAPGTPRLPPYGQGNRRATSQTGSARGSQPPRIGANFPAMGQFGAPAAQLSSQERYQQSLMNPAASSGFGGRPGGMMRQPSAGPMKAMGGMTGMNRNDRRSNKGSQRRPDHSRQASQMVLSGEYVEPLQTTDNAWTPNVGAAAGRQQDTNAPEYVQRKVKALLNKLTMEKFDSISNQILEWANKSEQETDGFTLRQVIALIFEKATDEAQWSEMYARLCRKIQEVLSPNVKDASLGDSVSGGSLFRKYLLNRCQEDYEKGWTEKQQASVAAAAKADDDKAKQAANEKAKADEAEAGADKAQTQEAEMMSDEYYIAQKAKRRGLGLVRFIGELYKLNMLTARIMRECVVKLLSNVTDPEEEDMEALVRLLTTVGKQLEDDNPSKSEEGLKKSRGLMSVYFERLQAVRNNDAIPSRIQFMVQDLMDMRRAGWKGKPGVGGPKTIAEIHKDAKQAEMEASRRTASSGGRLPTLNQQLGGRQTSRRGAPRDVGPDGWQAVGTQPAPPARPRQAGDLTAFGKVRGSGSGTERVLGSGNSVFSRKNQPRPDAPAEAPRQQNAFAALAGDSGEQADTSERPKIQLLARTKPLEGEEEASAGAQEGEEEQADEEEGDEDEPQMDEETIKRSIKNSVAEYFAVKNLQEGIETFKALPVDARHRLAEAIGTAALDKKEPDVKLVALLYTAVHEQEVMSTESFMEAMKPLVETIDDLSTDVPKAYTYIGMLLRGAKLSEEQVKTLSESMEAEELEEAQERLIGAFTSSD